MRAFGGHASDGTEERDSVLNRFWLPRILREVQYGPKEDVCGRDACHSGSKRSDHVNTSKCLQCGTVSNSSGAMVSKSIEDLAFGGGKQKKDLQAVLKKVALCYIIRGQRGRGRLTIINDDQKRGGSVLIIIIG